MLGKVEEVVMSVKSGLQLRDMRLPISFTRKKTDVLQKAYSGYLVDLEHSDPEASNGRQPLFPIYLQWEGPSLLNTCSKRECWINSECYPASLSDFLKSWQFFSGIHVSLFF